LLIDDLLIENRIPCGLWNSSQSTIRNQQSTIASPGQEKSMSTLRLKIDVSGTVGDEAWREIKQFDQIQSADFGPQFGSGGRCNHAPDAPHGKGEWIGAEIRLQTPLLAQYAMSHYLEQERVLDADVEE
jgi:hypothetical protein